MERCNHTIEECTKKIMMSQEDWEPMLPSVLFALCISKHSSSGMSPYRLLYQRDPILPFQFMDRLKNGGLNTASDCLNHGGSPFKVGEKVLKRNMRDASHKQKMKSKYTGPWHIIKWSVLS